ncbi:MAG: cadherin-like beta sandwich domain-containing protein [Clostridia bacterium]|nr:cadherin-like beta sandwich domain-containing protein [Clostridia bacterium]
MKNSYGGGVYVYGTFTMSGGEIINNEALSADTFGGGVNANEFTMTGGTISGNRASDGGGVFVGGTFEMSGGTISGNRASYDGGVFVGGTFKVSGTVTITGNKRDSLGKIDNNVYLDGTTITVDGTLDEGSVIGVTVEFYDDTAVIATGFVQEGNPADFFIADNGVYSCIYISNAESGEVTVGEHTGGTATCTAKAVCDNCGEQYGELGGHDWATDWTYDDENSHWHACNNGCGEKGDEDTHTFTDGECTVCGYTADTNNELENLTINGIDCTAADQIGVHFDFVFDCDDGNFSFHSSRGTNDFSLSFDVPEGAAFTVNSSTVSLPYTFTVEDGEMEEITVNVKSGLDLISGGEGKTYVIKVYVADKLHRLDDLKIYVSETDLTDVLDFNGDPLYFDGNPNMGTMLVPFKTKSAYILPVANDFLGKIKIGTETLNSISDGLVKEFIVGDNIIEIFVFSELEALAAGDEKINDNSVTYTLNIARLQGSQNAYLNSLTVEIDGTEVSFTDDGENVAFNKNKLAYHIENVSVNAQTIGISAVAADENATVSGDGNQAVNLSYDTVTQTFTVTVTAEDETTTKEYTVTVHRTAAIFEVLVGENDKTYYSTIEDAFAAANTADTATVTMYADAEISQTLVVNAGKTITLNLNGHILKMTGSGRVITVNGTFTLKDDSESGGGTVTGGNSAEGGGVYVDGGIFEMTAGTISGNRGLFNGGGVGVAENGSFTMTGGTISGNEAYGGNGYGGGVSVAGTFEMSGTAQITDNTAYADGGGVYVKGNGTFEMSGTAQITGNTANIGGGVYVAGTFEMTGGTISGNAADGNGGGVFVSSYSTFEMSGGTISGNTATEGGGVYVKVQAYSPSLPPPITYSSVSSRSSGGVFRISGTPVINENTDGNDGKSNICLENGAVIEVDGTLEEGTILGMSSTGVIATGFMQEGNPAEFFIPDDNANDCVYISDKENGTVTIGTHDIVHYEAKQPTCTEAGWEEYDGCSHCGYGIDKVELPALGHSWGDGEITTPATCTTDGVKTFTCANDSSHTRTEVIPATDHSWGDGEITTPATCTTDGEKTFTCANDSSHTRTEAIPAFGHDWNDGEITTEATCTTDGEKTFTCANDGSHTRTEVIPATDHEWNDGEITTAATCTTDGEKTFTCANDGSHTKTEVIPALGHNIAQHEGQAATCTEAGWEAYETCSRCDYSTKVEIPALGHSLNHKSETDATEDKDGNTEYWECDNCHKYFSDEAGKTEITDKSSVVIPKLPKNGGSVLWIILIIILVLIILAEIAFITYRKLHADAKEKKL